MERLRDLYGSLKALCTAVPNCQASSLHLSAVNFDLWPLVHFLHQLVSAILQWAIIHIVHPTPNSRIVEMFVLLTLF